MPAFAVALAALSALVWGSADYCGGRATRLASAWAVTVRAQLAGAALLGAVVFLFPGTLYATDLAWGGAAGIAGIIGLVLLYQGLATGNAAVVAPVTAVTSAVVPMIVGLVSQRVPDVVPLAGAVCAVVAIGLVSVGPSAPDHATPVGPRVLVLALTSGALFGVFFVLLAQAHDDSGMWPLVGARVCSITVGLLFMARLGVSLRLPARTGAWVLAAGIGDVGANALYLLAARSGPLSVVAPVAALYPVATVLLALVVDRERIRPWQGVGLALAAAALVLTAI
ncbi:EamA family transporter [Luedemannella helvata]|uniref:EamA domain-containing protein n=1 Tax=Luedemannella helvata TaxID=349315 RepID=A0ABP4XEU1_9ACTN